MKKPLILFAIVILVLCSETARNLAQENAKEEIVINLILKKENFEREYRFPTVLESEDSILGGLTATTDCSDCALTSQYGFWVLEIKPLGEIKTRITFASNFADGKCSSSRKIFVERNKKNIFKLKCGAKVITYFDTKKRTN